MNINPHILALPLELREHIYKDVLLHPSCEAQFLRTCKEIYAEAHKFLYQRPLSFCSQAALYEWLEVISPQYLPQVTEIIIELQEIDLKPLLSQTSSADETNSPPRLLAWELHESELKTLRRNLQKMPNIKTLTIRGLSQRPSFLYREFLGKFLQDLSTVWEGLQGLSLEGSFHHQSLTFLSSLSGLRSFSFDGFSATSDTDTASILSGLQHLTSLSLVSQHSLLTPTTHLHSSFTSKRQSFTGNVARATRQLASFSVTERPLEIPSPALFFTPEVLSSLHNHLALCALSISLSQTPDTETLEALEAFLAESSITMLELDWPSLTARTLDRYALISNKLREFWVRVTSMSIAFEMLQSILQSRERGDLLQLMKIVLIKGNWCDADAESGEEPTSHSSHSLEIMENVRPSNLVNTGKKSDSNLPATNKQNEDNVHRVMMQLQALSVKVLWRTQAH